MSEVDLIFFFLRSLDSVFHEILLAWRCTTIAYEGSFWLHGQSRYRQASDREFLISDVLCVICEIKKSMHRLPAVNPTRAAAATLHMEA